MIESGSEHCDGCHDPKPPEVELRTFRMEHGGTETLCPDCVAESHGIIVEEVGSDE